MTQLGKRMGWATFGLALFATYGCGEGASLSVEEVGRHQQQLGCGGGTTERINVATDGSQANGPIGSFAARLGVTSDSRYVVFVSEATNLVAGDTNANADVFVRDRVLGETTRVSVSSSGQQGNGRSVDPSVSSDGRFIAFTSTSTNLVANDTNQLADVFVHDRQTGQTSRVSVASTGIQANGASTTDHVSGDGRYVVFRSQATNLVAGDTNNFQDVFVYDRQTGQTKRVSVSSSGQQANGSSAAATGVSHDGRYVVFSSTASNLVPNDTNGFLDVFVHDQELSTTTRVSVSSTGVQANADCGTSESRSISADGRYVAFSTPANNLVSGDTNNREDAFVHDRQTGETTRVSVSSSGVQGNADSLLPSLSDDGQVVVFRSDASNLVPGDVNGFSDIFMRDRQTGETTLISVASTGAQGNAGSLRRPVTADGSIVIFTSTASNLVIGDTNNEEDVFSRSLELGGPAWAPNVAYQVDDVVTYAGNAYRCRQPHTSLTGWEPPSTPALWEIPGDCSSPEWQAQVQYAAGNIVSYQGTDYQCVQSHMSLTGWEPPNTPALWVVAQ